MSISVPSGSVHDSSGLNGSPLIVKLGASGMTFKPSRSRVTNTVESAWLVNVRVSAFR
jgi:hypothetical protein